MGKRTIYFNCGIFILLCASFFIPLLSHAQDISDNIYKDPNNYFIFKPPAGWKKEEITNKLTSQVNFRSPDGKATLGILAELDGGNLNYLLFKKRRFVKDHRQRYPEGAFSVSLAVLAGRDAIKMDFEMPRVAKQEYYFFYSKGLRFDLIYGVVNTEDFEKYRQAAIDSFSTIQPQEQIIWPKKRQENTPEVIE